MVTGWSCRSEVALSVLFALSQRYQAQRSEDTLRQAESLLPTQPAQASRLIQLAATELRQVLQHRIQDWKRREAETPVQSPPPSHSLGPFLESDPAWKIPLRQRLEHLRRELPAWAPSATAGRGWLGSLRATLDGSLREELPRRLFEQLQSALQRGLEQYHRDLIYQLDRLWDDFLDRCPQAEPALGLEQNPRWADQLLEQLRQRLQLKLEGGFALPRSWTARPDLWMRSSQSWPVTDMIREIEQELIVQLGQDLSSVYADWLRPIDQFYAEQGNSRAALLQEQEQLRQDWQLLHESEQRFPAPRE